MSLFQSVEVFGTIITILVVLGIWNQIMRRIAALNELVTAQLTAEGEGGDKPLVEKVKTSAIAVQNLQQSVDSLTKLVTNNHAVGEEQFDGLRREDAEIQQSMDSLTKLVTANHAAGEEQFDGLRRDNAEHQRRLETIEQLAAKVEPGMAEALARQSQLVGRVDGHDTRLDEHGHRIERLEHKVFGEDVQ